MSAPIAAVLVGGAGGVLLVGAVFARYASRTLERGAALDLNDQQRYVLEQEARCFVSALNFGSQLDGVDDDCF